MAGVVSVIVCVSIFALIGLGAYVYCKVWERWYDKREAKRKAEHPALFKLFDEIDEKGSERIHWHNEQIAPKKRQVDYILREMPYYTAEVRAQKEQELESLRCAIHVATVVYNDKKAEIEELRKSIHKYVEQHDLEWARKWGW